MLIRFDCCTEEAVGVGVGVGVAALGAELVYQILAEIPESHALVHQTCKGWVKKFQFEKILDLTEPLVGR